MSVKGPGFIPSSAWLHKPGPGSRNWWFVSARRGVCSPFPRMQRSPCVHGLGVRGLTFGDSLPGPLMRSSQVILLAEQGNACGLPSQEKELCPSPGARHICGDSPGRVGTALNQLVPSLGLELCIPNPTTLLYPYLCWSCTLGVSVFPRDPKSD